MYTWSIRSLERCLRCFEICYNNPEVSMEAGSQRCRGRRSWTVQYNLHVTGDAVDNVMYNPDPEGLEARGWIGAKKKRKNGNFSSKDPNFVHSLDGHEKMVGSDQNSTFRPLSVIQQAEKYCDFQSGRQIRIQNWLVVGKWSIWWRRCDGHYARILEEISQRH